MYVVEVNAEFPFIAGIFEKAFEAERFVEKFSNEVFRLAAIRELAGFAFPFYITEDWRGFLFYRQEEILQEIVQLRSYPKDLDDSTYTNLYRIDEPFVPDVPGEDVMGGLDHHHVTDETLAEIERDGFESLWLEGE